MEFAAKLQLELIPKLRCESIYYAYALTMPVDGATVTGTMIGKRRKPSRLRAQREKLGKTLEHTAVAAGISVAWLRQLERDPTLLTPRIAERLLPVLRLTADEVRT